MVQTPASGRRKRGLSTNGDSATGSVTKKRKVEDSPTTNGTSVNRRSIAAYARWEKRKQASAEQISGSRKSTDDRSNEEPTSPLALTARGKKAATKKKGTDPYDLPRPDAHKVTTPTKKKKPTSATSTPNGIKSRGKKSIPVTELEDGDESEGNVYDLMQIDESPSKPPTEKKRGPGRPPGSKNKGGTEASSRGMRDLESTPTKNRKSRPGLDGDIPKSPAVLKGILTPSKRRNDDTPRKRKNVAFTDAGDKDDFDIFFDDLPTKKKSESRKVQQKPRPTPLAPESKKPSESEIAEGDSDEEDEDVCEICLKPDSNPPNEIIFCDGCDLGFHQKCHNVRDIPDDDWFCKNCSQEDAAKTPQRASAVAPAPPTDAPDIPNLARHLSVMQRVLLDRCTGRRRLNLVGLDEAYGKVEQLVEKTITEGEGNSMLLIGGRGTGKTAVSITRQRTLNVESGAVR